MSSAIYLLNDVVDIERDRLHPWKKFRPIAAGQISIRAALNVALLLGVIALVAAFLINPAFLFVCFAYLGLQISYSLLLKRIVLLDIFGLATGYLLRVYGGEFATGWHISVWLLLAVVSVSLFLAVGKRRAELSLLQARGVKGTRSILVQYPEKLLDVYIAMFANATWLTYAFFTFFEHSTVRLRPQLLGVFLHLFPWGIERKWMMTTIPVIMYVITRYMQVAYTQEKGESPEKIFLSDRPLIISLFIWAAMIIFIIYSLGA